MRKNNFMLAAAGAALIALCVFTVSDKRPLFAAASSHSITLTWTASPSAAVYPSGSDYAIYRASTSGGEAPATPYATVSSTATTYIDSNVTPNNTYYYTVAFCVGAVCSAMSNEAYATVPLAAGDLSAPTGLAAVAK